VHGATVSKRLDNSPSALGVALQWALGTMRKQTNNIQLQNGERMDASKLTEGQIDYICRYALTPILEECERAKRSKNKQDVGIIYANATIEKIQDIFISTGYWKERGNQ
jgi:hypothetical protein